jgi:citrate lyase subunit beta/citryl-CoA lyase
MNATPPRWRSPLFVPAHVERCIARAHERGADGIILDLEEAAPAAGKPAGRARLAESIASIGRNGTAAMVRVDHGLRALVSPKVGDAGFVREVADAEADLPMVRRAEEILALAA